MSFSSSAFELSSSQTRKPYSSSDATADDSGKDDAYCPALSGPNDNNESNIS